MQVTSEERNWAVFIHLSCYLSFFTLGIGLIGPLIFWLIKRADSDFLDEHGCQAVNYHLSMLLYSLGVGVGTVLIAMITLGIGILFMLPFIIILPILTLIITIFCSVKAAMEANAGYSYEYPFTITFVRPRYQMGAY